MRARTIGGILAVILAGLALSWFLRGLDGGPLGSSGGGPERVVLFAPNLTETAFELGHGGQVVATTDYCLWPEQARRLPKVGGIVDPNLERILALQPDLLVLQGRNELLRRFADRQGIRIASVKMDDDLDSILKGIARVDSLLSGGSSEAATARIARIERSLKQIRTAVEGRERPRVLLVLGHAPGTLTDLLTAGKGSFLNELVEIAGGRPMFADHGIAYFKLALETLLADPPDVALELLPGRTIDEAVREEIEAPWRRMGLTETRVEILGFDGLMIPGPRVDETARAFLGAIHPDAELPR